MNGVKTVKVHELFSKAIDRPIEGVIKADYLESLLLEVQEYVLTEEVIKRLEEFLDSYNNYTFGNGVWISGFFGSGKSHLLKMLAFVMENRQIEGLTVLDLFLAKCGDNQFLRADLKRACTIPSESILFNIDQKADIISKSEIDALLAVFVKVFNEHCGYYGKVGHIAEFERDLDQLGLLDEYKTQYEKIAGQSWERGRETAKFESKRIAQAYAVVRGESEEAARGILDKYRQDYKVSIEDFALQVRDYVEGKGDGFRLNFFVDEVGQYIADNTKLMTNLQTIAESLGTICGGRAWLIVTAQEDMETVVGDMSERQSNDFSKIQARFPVRMKLTSHNVDEVIQKRLLDKKEECVEPLSDIYHAQFNSFKTLFDFADGAASYANYKDRDHFVGFYPFIPYQFTLFQTAIQSLSKHNAFEGRHSSVGERSMLGVFQVVAIEIGKKDVGHLATFDLMFEGIRTALKTQVHQSVINAEKHLHNPFAIRLLKALFMVKYVDSFKATVRNLCVLMLESFEQDIGDLKAQIEEALNLLEQQTYIQRTGEVYTYLTDEEKDIETEIKNMTVDNDAIRKELEKIAFDQVYNIRKMKLNGSGMDYAFSRKIDDQLYGRAYELGINIITPFYKDAGDSGFCRQASLLRDELIIMMPVDERLLRDAMLFKQTESYISQKTTAVQHDGVKRILSDKADQNRQRLENIKDRMHLLLGESSLFVAGTELAAGSEDPQARLQQGFQELITKTYPYLRMLGHKQYSEAMIPEIIQQVQGSISGLSSTPLEEPEQEMLSYIQSQSNMGMRPTVKSLLERFEKKEYGWPYPAILCVLASLCARGKVDLRSGGNVLDINDLEGKIRNTGQQANLLLEPQQEFTPAQIRKLKTFYEEFFRKPPASSEARDLGKDTAQEIKELNQEINKYLEQQGQYAFLKNLAPVQDKLKEAMVKPYSWYLNDFAALHEPLLDLKEQILDPIRRFMEGEPRKIYDGARDFVQKQQVNFSFLQGTEGDQLIDALNDPECYKGGKMQSIKSMVDRIAIVVNEQVANEIKLARDKVSGLQAAVESMPEYQSGDQEQKAQIQSQFDNIISFVNQQQVIAVIREKARIFEEQAYPRILSQIAGWSKPTVKPGPEPARGQNKAGPGGSPSPQPPKPVPQPPKPEVVSAKSITISYKNPWLINAEDVDEYLRLLRQEYVKQIDEGKRIQV